MPSTLLPTESMPILNENRLEQLFARIERNKNPNTTETDPYLAIQFLSRFGLTSAKKVIEFLHTHGGTETINMIVQEIIKEEAQIQYVRDTSDEQVLKHQQLLFLLMAFIAKDKKLAQHVNEIIQKQIEQKLKEIKTVEAKKSSSIIIPILDENIRAYSSALRAVDQHLKSLEDELEQIEEELNALENEATLAEENHAYMIDHLEELNAFLQAPLFNNQPITHFVSHSNQQIANLSSQLAFLRAQHPPQTANSSNTSKSKEIESPVARKIRMLQERLDFYNAQVVQPPQSPEQVVQQLIERARFRLEKQQRSSEETSSVYEGELEGLRLQERGFHQALQYLKNEKILLNSQLERVNDFSQAHFIIDPSHQGRYRKHGDSYIFLPENINTERFTQEDLLQARQNYERLRSDICCVTPQYHEQRQQYLDALFNRRQCLQDRRINFIDRIDEDKASKVQLLHALSSAKAQRALLNQGSEALTPFTITPKPTLKPSRLDQQNSYSLMMNNLECSVPSPAPAPCLNRDISNPGTGFNDRASPVLDELLRRLDEVKPEDTKVPEVRLG